MKVTYLTEDKTSPLAATVIIKAIIADAILSVKENEHYFVMNDDLEVTLARVYNILKTLKDSI